MSGPAPASARDKQKLVETIEDNDRMKRELDRLKAQDNAGSLFDLKAEPAAQIARVIVNTVTDYKADQIDKALGAAITKKIWGGPLPPPYYPGSEGGHPTPSSRLSPTCRRQTAATGK
jgi:hypothetical protein